MVVVGTSGQWFTTGSGVCRPTGKEPRTFILGMGVGVYVCGEEALEVPDRGWEGKTLWFVERRYYYLKMFRSLSRQKT